MMAEPKKETYECEYCHGVFEFEWTEEEALAEMQETFGELPEEDQAIVCDDCYNKIMEGW